ncbi:hypothetical protein [Wolbachia endosymbiont (group A) of Sphecodes monilicornis]|uniref:hypothetical protein n=1 Tax=Wolbachia endosymbiont (group A) of Sphecodes monilicornis TaxID=2954060 RepID=UPI002226AA7B|nr:hypothetical protein [Wolbachia endosymbiont (group A) of Sphecodes monilicornis]
MTCSDYYEKCYNSSPRYLLAAEIPRRYDVEAILLYSPTQYPIWIQVVKLFG